MERRTETVCAIYSMEFFDVDFCELSEGSKLLHDSLFGCMLCFALRCAVFVMRFLKIPFFHIVCKLIEKSRTRLTLLPPNTSMFYCATDKPRHCWGEVMRPIKKYRQYASLNESSGNWRLQVVYSAAELISHAFFGVKTNAELIRIHLDRRFAFESIITTRMARSEKKNDIPHEIQQLNAITSIKRKNRINLSRPLNLHGWSNVQYLLVLGQIFGSDWHFTRDHVSITVEIMWMKFWWKPSFESRGTFRKTCSAQHTGIDRW